MTSLPIGVLRDKSTDFVATAAGVAPISERPNERAKILEITKSAGFSTPLKCFNFPATSKDVIRMLIEPV